MLRGKGPRGLRAASMAAGQVQNPNLMGQHIVVSLRPGASKVRFGARWCLMTLACCALMLLEARLHCVSCTPQPRPSRTCNEKELGLLSTAACA